VWGDPIFGVKHDLNLAVVIDTASFTGYAYDAVLDLHYAQFRMYDATARRFTQEDPYWNSDNIIYGNTDNAAPNISAIRQFNNLFAYALNNPIMYVDPSGETAYVFYDPNIFGVGTGEKYAKSMASMLKNKYKTDVEFIEMSDFWQFQKDWGSMTDVDAVSILAHANASAIRLSTLYVEEDGVKVEDDNPNHKRMYLGDIKNLAGDINIPMIFLGACNTAANDDEKTLRVRLWDLTGLRQLLPAMAPSIIQFRFLVIIAQKPKVMAIMSTQKMVTEQ